MIRWTYPQKNWSLFKLKIIDRFLHFFVSESPVFAVVGVEGTGVGGIFKNGLETLGVCKNGIEEEFGGIFKAGFDTG